MLKCEVGNTDAIGPILLKHLVGITGAFSFSQIILEYVVGNIDAIARESCQQCEVNYRGHCARTRIRIWEEVGVRYIRYGIMSKSY